MGWGRRTPRRCARSRARRCPRAWGRARSRGARGGRRGPLPLSFAQERLWFLHRMQPDTALYNIPTVLELRGILNQQALERALGEIIRRHEILRTTFVEVDGSSAQAIAPFAGFTLRVDDVSHLPRAEREAEARRRGREEGGRPFDLATGPLFRPTLVRLDDTTHALLLCMHHIVSDAWGMGWLFRHLSLSYEAYPAGRDAALPALPVQYGDYAIWQREPRQAESYARQLAWWTQQLAGAPELI